MVSLCSARRCEGGWLCPAWGVKAHFKEIRSPQDTGGHDISWGNHWAVGRTEWGDWDRVGRLRPSGESETEWGDWDRVGRPRPSGETEWGDRVGRLRPSGESETEWGDRVGRLRPSGETQTEWGDWDRVGSLRPSGETEWGDWDRVGSLRPSGETEWGDWDRVGTPRPSGDTQTEWGHPDLSGNLSRHSVELINSNLASIVNVSGHVILAA